MESSGVIASPDSFLYLGATDELLFRPELQIPMGVADIAHFTIWTRDFVYNSASKELFHYTL